MGEVVGQWLPSSLSQGVNAKNSFQLRRHEYQVKFAVSHACIESLIQDA